MRIEDIDFDILLDEKSHENILTHDNSYKAFMGAKPRYIRFDKIDRIIKTYDGTRYLELFGPKLYNAIYDRINYLVSKKSDAKYIINHNFARIRIDSHNSLPIEKTLTFHNVIILIKSVFIKNKNNYYFNIFLEKSLYENKSNTQCF